MRCSNGIVGRTCSLLTCLYTAVSTLTITLPPQTLSNTFATSSLVNTTTPDSAIDPRFGFKAIYGETNLPSTPCLMNVVELLSQYAELNWRSKVRRRHGVVLPSYPQVEIAVLPAAPATSVEVRLVIWGIWVGIRDIINKNSFHEVEFELFWESEVAAYIYLTKPMDLQVTGRNQTLGPDETLTLLSPLNETTGDMLNTSNSTQKSSDDLNEGQFSWFPYFTPEAKTLTVIEVFLTVMAALKNTAPYPASDKVPGPYSSAAVDVYANMQIFLYRRRLPRTKAPFFRYIHVIKALRLVPAYMLEMGRFSELFFSVGVSGLTIGEGYLGTLYFLSNPCPILI